ncbi:MAG: AIR carboxylase family protein [Anaerolineae bacterium]|nr:AIR carboxylase family protein [Anaerolineae bacterium]
MSSLVVILMGSGSDREHAEAIASALAKFGITAELRIGSAHKTPAHALAILEHYEADPRPKVYITIAGRSNALSGFVDAQVSAPVIACPPSSSSFGGADIYSSLRMPGGVAPAVVLEPANAALLAAKILALGDADVKARVVALQTDNRDKVLRDDAALQSARTEEA